MANGDSENDEAKQRGQTLGQALGRSLGQFGGQVAPGGNSAVPPNAFLGGDRQNGDPLATAFLPEREEPTATPVGEPERMGMAPSLPRIEDMPDSLTPEEMDMYDDLARAEVLARNGGDLPESLTPEEMDLFGFQDITEDDLAEITAQQIANNIPPTLYGYKAFRKKQAQRSELDKAGGFLANAWNMAKFVGYEAAAASTAIVDAVGLPNFATEEELREIRVDPDRRTSWDDLKVSAAEGVLRWQAQLGVMGQNTMDSVTGGLFEEIANVDKPSIFSDSFLFQVARKVLPKDYEIDEDTEIELEYRRILRNMERELSTLPQEGESIAGAITTGRALDRGESVESAVEAGQRMTEHVVEPLANTLSYAPDFLLGFGAARIVVGTKARALVPSTVSRKIVESAGRAVDQTGKLPFSLRASQKIDSWARETATPFVDKGIKKLGSKGPSIAAGISALASGAGGLHTALSFAAPYVARGALTMGFGAIKWTGRSSRRIAEPFARALKAKHEFGPAGPSNAGMWARVAADTNAPGWARTTAGVSNRMLTNPKVRQLISDSSNALKGAGVGSFTESLQEALEESLQTGATAESIGGGFGAGATVGAGFGGIAGLISGPRDIDGHLMDIDVLHFRNKMAERGDDTSYFDNLPREVRRDIAAAQAAAINSADVRLVNQTQFTAETSRPGKFADQGVWRSSTGEVLINTDIVGPNRIAKVVSHELGHTAYYRLPDEKKAQWRDIAHRTYGDAVVEKFRLDYSREVGFEIDTDWALDEMFAEHFFGVSGAGRKLLDRKRQISGDFGVGRSMRQVKDSVLAMLGIESAGKDVQGETLLKFTPYKADPAIESFIHESLRDLGNKHVPPDLPKAESVDPFETNLPEQEAATIDSAVQANGAGSVVEIGNGKHVVLLGQRPDGTFDTFDLDRFEQAIRDLPPDDTRSHRARVAAALEQAKTGRRDRDPELAAMVDALTAREGLLPPSLRVKKEGDRFAAKDDITSRIKSAYRGLADRSQGWVELHDLRKQLSGVAREDVDAALKQMFLDQEINLTLHEDQGSLTEEHHQASVRLGPNQMHMVSMRTDRFAPARSEKEVEKPEISSIVENAHPSQLKGARPPGKDRYAVRRRTVEPSDILSIAGRTLSETPTASADSAAIARDELNAIQGAAPILSARNQRKARLATESRVGGSEHKVLIEPGNEWVTKVWDAHENRALDTPFDYLKRIGLQNQFFGDNIQVLGIYDGTGIVTRQPFYDSADPSLSLQPTELEIREYMADRGFRMVEPRSNLRTDDRGPVARAIGGLLDRAEQRFQDDSVTASLGAIEYSNGRVTVADARPDNFVRKEDGELQLIDALIMEEERPARAEPDNFDDVVDDVDSTERFDEDELGDILGDARSDRFAPAQEPGRTPGLLQEDRTEAGELRGRGRVAGSETGVQEPYRPYPPSNERPLDNLASTVKVDGRRVEFGPLPAARDAARSYMRQAGLPYNLPTDYVRVDPERATRIADEFERMEHAPNDPEVKAAYRAMIDETLAQYDAIKETGLVVEPIPFGQPDPYGNPRNAILDVVENNHMWFFPTQAGFGGPASTSVDISGNPLLEPTGETINGHEMVANDVFRVVHDYFGHIKEGVGFRADGEENAWRSHSSMYSDLARRAMTTETRGQNSWVNFGPFGEQNRTANGADTEYAPQKIGLLPEWVVEEGRGGGIVEDASPTPTSPALGASLSAEAADTGGPADLGRAGEGGPRPGDRLATSDFRSRRGPGTEAYNRTRPRAGVSPVVRAAQERIANKVWDRVGPETDHFRRGVTGTPQMQPVVHYSTAESPQTLDPARSGTGTPGAEERRRRQNPILYPGRIYFGDQTYAAQPEGFVTSQARSRVDAELDMDQVWTYDKHPELLDIAKETAQAEEGGLGNAATYLEAAVEAAGYQGLYFPDHNAGYLLHEMSVPEVKSVTGPFVPQGTLEPISRGDRFAPITLFRATNNPGDATSIPKGSAWSPDRSTAQAYTDNPGFGGSQIIQTQVDPNSIADARGTSARDLDPIAELLGVERQELKDSGFDSVFSVLENKVGAIEALNDAGFEWIRFLDDFPENAETWVALQPTSPISRSDQSPLGSSLAGSPGDRFAVSQFSSPEGNLPTTVPSETASRGTGVSDTIVFEDVFRKASSGLNKGRSLASHAAKTFRNRWKDQKGNWHQGMPGIRPEALRGSDRKVVEAVAGEISENLHFLWDHPLVAPWRDRARQWYVGANRLATSFSGDLGVSLRQAAATIVSLSPQKDWNMNVSLAERVGRFLTSVDKSQPLTHRQIDTMVAKIRSYSSKQMSDAAKARTIETLEGIRGVAFDQIGQDSRANRIREAWFLRTWDETTNPRSYDIISPEGDRVRQSTDSITWGSAAEIANAIQAMRSDDPASLSTALGKGHKVRNFYNNILTPESPLYGTIDTHQIGADFLSPLGGGSVLVSDSMTGRKGIPAKTIGEVGLTGTYPIHWEGLRRAAEARDALPREMQSVTWEALRGIFSPAFRRGPGATRVLNIWDAVKDGSLSKEDAISRVIDTAGGLTPPPWHDSGDRFAPIPAPMPSPSGVTTPAFVRPQRTEVDTQAPQLTETDLQGLGFSPEEFEGALGGLQLANAQKADRRLRDTFGVTYKDVADTYRAHLSDFDLRFNFTDVSEKGGILKDSVNLSITENSGDLPLINLSRVLKRKEDGTVTAWHSYSTIAKDLQGQGVMKRIFQAQLELYDKIGVDRIQNHANIDVGGYAWARYGFLPDSWDSLRKRLIDTVKEDALVPPEQIGRVMAILNNPDPRAIRALADLRDHPITETVYTAASAIPETRSVTLGQHLLTDTEWFGTLDLNDPGSYNVLRHYIGAR